MKPKYITRPSRKAVRAAFDAQAPLDQAPLPAPKRKPRKVGDESVEDIGREGNAE